MWNNNWAKIIVSFSLFTFKHFQIIPKRLIGMYGLILHNRHICTRRLLLPTMLDNAVLDQAWATSGLRATYGPQSTFMWPASYIWSYLDCYFDNEKTLKIKAISASKTNFKSVYIDMYWPTDTNLSLMWPATPKEFPTPVQDQCFSTDGPWTTFNGPPI